MTKTPYRNALRSKQMIRNALIQLMKQRGFNQIKTKDVIELANISKGTFYAHYISLHEVLQEIENVHLAEMFESVNMGAGKDETENFYLLFLRGLTTMKRHPEVFCLLFQPGYGNSFVEKLKQKFFDLMLNGGYVDSYFKDRNHAVAYLTYVAGGAIMLIQAWIQNGYLTSPENVAAFLSECATTGIGSKKLFDGIKPKV